MFKEDERYSEEGRICTVNYTMMNDGEERGQAAIRDDGCDILSFQLRQKIVEGRNHERHPTKGHPATESVSHRYFIADSGTCHITLMVFDTRYYLRKESLRDEYALSTSRLTSAMSVDPAFQVPW